VATVLLYAAVVATFHARRDAVAAAEPLTLSRPAAVPGEATLLFAGDTAETDTALPTLRARGFAYPFGATLDLVRGADVAVANAEAPISDGGTRFPLWTKWAYRAPAASASALAEAGFDVLTLANNHIVDDGADGLADTIALAAQAGMVAIGAGHDPAEARRGVVVDVGGLRVGLVAYCERQVLLDIYVDLYARHGHAGAAMLAEPDFDRDVRRLRARADLVVVALHAGDNYAPPSRAQLDWARRAIDAGADLVVEHHPHVAHPVAVYRGRAIALSLGNYAFGTPGRFPARDPAPDIFGVGLLAVAHARRCAAGGAAFDRLELVPIAVHNQRVRYRPEPLHGPALADVLARLRAASAPLGADVVPVGERGVVTLPGCSP
jgi:poly-gamma-glutamate synthesis protein (capsule biosynthesis protein)